MPQLKKQLMSTWMLEIEMIPIGDLVPDPTNARIHDEKQVRDLAANMHEFDQISPTLVDEANGMLAGHGRRKAALLNGVTHVPCIRILGLTAQQKKALALADNKLHDMSSFDPDRLLATLIELDVLDYDIGLAGFDTAELDALQESLSAIDEVADPADQMPLPGLPAVSRLGDLWLLGTHRLLCANSLEEESFKKLLDNKRADLIFCDQPFNVPVNGHVSGNGKVRHREFAFASGEMSPAEFTSFLISTMILMARYSTDGSIHYQCIDWRHIGEMRKAGEAAYTELKNICVWVKDSPGMGSFYRSQHELVFVFKNGKAPHQNNIQLGRNGRNRSNVWHYRGMNGFGRDRDKLLASHPSVKPIGLIADAIRDASKRGALVLDPFVGSGSTILAAERTRRRAAAIEIDPLYVDTAVRRWEAMTGKSVVLAGDGRSFVDIGAARDEGEAEHD